MSSSESHARLQRLIKVCLVSPPPDPLSIYEHPATINAAVHYENMHLQVLELSDITLEFPKPSAADLGNLDMSSATAYKDSVGLAFQENVSGISRLTSLSLSKVAFMHFMPRPPEQAGLTQLRQASLACISDSWPAPASFVGKLLTSATART